MSTAPTPKDRFTALDTLALVIELRALSRARVDKAFDLAGSGWSLVLRIPGEGRRELLLVPGRYAALVSETVPHREELSPFARELRRLLTGSLLASVAEPGGERLLELTFSRADGAEQLLLALELFGSGNVLVAREGRIVAVATPRQWAHRSVRVGAEYARPPRRTDPWSLPASEIEAELARSRTDLASTLAARLNLGGPIAEEILARTGVAPDEPAAPRAEELAPPLARELAALRAEVTDPPTGFAYARDGTIIDATPYASRRWAESGPVEERRFASFSEAAHLYFGSLVIVPPSAAEVATTRARQELERLIEQQRRAVEELAGNVERLQAQAEAIYSHYSEAEKALETAPAAESGARSFEVSIGDLTVPLLYGRTPRESAQALFDESKRVQAKLLGARTALAESEGRRDAPEEVPALTRSGPAAAPTRRKLHWFERYRWFISSEGAIVIAGRDAATNDLIVKRHLREGDFYVHADLHGAASVVVKHPSDSAAAVTEVTLREAAQWAVAYSKAWRAGLASATAFWVTPEQVSKAGASGEFVARGAWVVHGTKHYFRDLPTELAIGLIEYDGETLWTAAPPEAVRRRGTVRFILTPGPERDRPGREAELARELGIPRPLVQSLLPAGGFAVRWA